MCMFGVNYRWSEIDSKGVKLILICLPLGLIITRNYDL